jgi:hypothetical protein
MSRRRATNPDSEAPCELSAQQQRAIDLIVVGKSLTEAARVLDLSRQTLSEWANRHHGFRAALSQRRQEVWSSAGDALRSLLPAAIEALAEEMRPGGPDRLKAAMATLRLALGSGGLAPAGSTSAEEIAVGDAEALAEAARRRELRELGF